MIAIIAARRLRHIVVTSAVNSAFNTVEVFGIIVSIFFELKAESARLKVIYLLFN